MARPVSKTKKTAQIATANTAKSIKKALSRSVSSRVSDDFFSITKADIARQEILRQDSKTLMIKSSEKRQITFVEQDSEQVTRAKQACATILHTLPPCGLKEHELYAITHFIEHGLKKQIEKGNFYLNKEKTKLARTIEYDPETKRVFIHLKTHHVDAIGKGFHKKVTRSILYDIDSPELVANSTMSEVNTKEIKYLKKTMGAKGLAETYAITTHSKKGSNKTVRSIIQKLYSGGTLYHFQHNAHELTEREKLVVCRDLLQGLESLHDKDIVHRDLHGNNVLLHRNQNSISAVIIDLGQAKNAEKAKKETPLIQIPKRFNPAESFWRKDDKIDAKAIDLYGLGMNLYHLYYGVAPEWAPHDAFKKIQHLSDDKKIKFRKELIEKTEKVLNKRRKELENNNSEYALLGKIVIQMCDPHKKGRGTAREHRLALDALIKTMK
jgi:serine/threonine protein kinase